MDNTTKVMAYSDESHHTKDDNEDFIVLASVYMYENTKNKVTKEVNNYLRRNNLSGELKWNKISKSNVSHYQEVMKIIRKYQLNKEIFIRTLLGLNKSKVNNSDLKHYRVMYFYLFRYVISILNDKKNFHFLIDRQDKYSGKNADNISKYLNNNFRNNFNISCTVEDSSEHRMIQIADIIAGAMSYKKKAKFSSDIKRSFVIYIEELFQIKLNEPTSWNNRQFNTFVWGKKI